MEDCEIYDTKVSFDDGDDAGHIPWCRTHELEASACEAKRLRAALERISLLRKGAKPVRRTRAVWNWITGLRDRGKETPPDSEVDTFRAGFNMGWRSRGKLERYEAQAALEGKDTTRSRRAERKKSSEEAP